MGRLLTSGFEGSLGWVLGLDPKPRPRPKYQKNFRPRPRPRPKYPKKIGSRPKLRPKYPKKLGPDPSSDPSFLWILKKIERTLPYLYILIWFSKLIINFFMYRRSKRTFNTMQNYPSNTSSILMFLLYKYKANEFDIELCIIITM